MCVCVCFWPLSYVSFYCCLCVGVCVRGRWTVFVTLKTSRSGSVRAREITGVYVRKLRSAPGMLSEQCLHMSVLSLQDSSSLTNTWNLQTVNKSFRVTFSSPGTGDGIIVSCDLRSSALERHYLTIYLVLDTSLSLFLSSLSWHAEELYSFRLHGPQKLSGHQAMVLREYHVHEAEGIRKVQAVWSLQSPMSSGNIVLILHKPYRLSRPHVTWSAESSTSCVVCSLYLPDMLATSRLLDDKP